MDERTEYSPGAYYVVSKLPLNKETTGIRVVVYIYLTEPLSSANTLMVISFEHKNESYSYTSLALDQQKLKLNHWNRLSLSTRLPSFKSPDDCMKFYIWNPGKQHFYLDDMKIDLVKAR